MLQSKDEHVVANRMKVMRWNTSESRGGNNRTRQRCPLFVRSLGAEFKSIHWKENYFTVAIISAWD